MEDNQMSADQLSHTTNGLRPDFSKRPDWNLTDLIEHKYFIPLRIACLFHDLSLSLRVQVRIHSDHYKRVQVDAGQISSLNDPHVENPLLRYDIENFRRFYRRMVYVVYAFH